MAKKIKLKDLLNENFPGITFSAIGGIVTARPINNQISLSSVVSEDYTSEGEEFDSKAFLEAVGGYNKYKTHIYREGNLRQVAEELGKMASDAKTHALKETDGWFDKVTVSRNMKELAGLSKNFKKAAGEAQSIQERVEGLYEDFGNILSRYYEIHDLDDARSDKKKRTHEDGLREEGAYQEFFKKALSKFGASSPDDLKDSQKKRFYNWIDKNWKAKKETD